MLPETAKSGESPTNLTADVDNTQVVSMTPLGENRRRKEKAQVESSHDGGFRILRQEAPVGVGPTMADLQSAALATWLRHFIA